MKIFAPSYYDKFACTADACRHSCCIGWEIDIDADTYAYYQGIGGAFGARLMEHIAQENDTAHFILGEKERCPFLNSCGLCDIYTELGEGALCRICTDHPRFRNFYEDRTEIGLGICCEAAARLILNAEEKTEIVLLGEEGQDREPDAQEIRFLAFRARVFAVLQDRSKSIDARIETLCLMLQIKMPQKSIAAWKKIYLGLEQLDSTWTTRLESDVQTGYVPTDTMREQLLCYFVYRHTADGIFDESVLARIAFAVHAADFICTLSADAEDFLEVARMYSAEIEYAEENLQTLLELM